MTELELDDRLDVLTHILQVVVRLVAGFVADVLKNIIAPTFFNDDCLNRPHLAFQNPICQNARPFHIQAAYVT